MHRLVLAAVVFSCGYGLTSPALAETPDAETCDTWAVSPAAWPEIEGTLRSNYAYLDRVDNLDEIFARASRSAAKATSIGELGAVVETLGYAFRDGHFHVRPGAEPERAWIPSSSDFWIVRDKERWLVEDVRAGGDAAKAGVRPGWEVVSLGSKPLKDHIEEALAPVLESPTHDQSEYTANVVASGYVHVPRTVVFRSPDGIVSLDLPPSQLAMGPPPQGLLQQKRLGDIAYVRFNNSLGDNRLIQEFDAAMERAGSAEAMILDLRDTPGGGVTTVARAILGYFVAEPVPYQVHRNVYEEVNFGVRRQYAEYVFPRGTQFKKPVVILAGRWTGSVGEALAMSLSSVAGAHSIGTPLADLLGTLNSNSAGGGCLSMSFAWDKLYSPAGMAREDWIPAIVLPSADLAPDGSDPALERALSYLSGAE